jgi:hypothetical protein
VHCPNLYTVLKGAVKLLLATRGHFSIMQLTNVGQLPMRGFSVTMAPLKLQVIFQLLTTFFHENLQF